MKSKAVSVGEALAARPRLRILPQDLSQARRRAERPNIANRVAWLRAAGHIGIQYGGVHPDIRQMKRDWQRLGHRPPNVSSEVYAGFQVQVLNESEPAPTIRARQCDYVRQYEDRLLVPGEVGRLCTFPEDFKMPEELSFDQRWERYGRAVPPLMMFAIAAMIRDALLKADNKRWRGSMAIGARYEPYTMADVAKVPKNGLNVISTFSGCGGSSLGYKMAGFDVRLALEFDKEAADTYELNFPKTPVLRKDVREVTGAELLRLARLRPGQLDVLDGSPPCFPAGLLVTTIDGPKLIEDVREGELVLTHSGRYRRVLTKMRRRFRGSLVDIAFKYGRSLSATAEHPFLAQRRKPETSQSWRPKSYEAEAWTAARDLQPRDVVLQPFVAESQPVPSLPDSRGRGTNQYGIVGRRSGFQVDDSQIAWILGLYLAEGWTRKTRPVINFGLHADEAPAVRARLEAAGFTSGCTPPDLKHPRAAKVHVWDAALLSLCLEFGRGARNKRIPEWVFGMSEKWQRELLEGYFYGDATRAVSTSVYWRMSTASQQLATGIARLVQQVFHVAPTIRSFTRKDASHIDGRTILPTPQWQVSFAVERGIYSRAALASPAGLWLPVKATSKREFSGYVYNLEVEEDQSYVVEGFAVHNCASFSTAGKREKGWGQIRDYSGQKQRTDDLFEEYGRLLSELKPRAFVAENVSGMKKGKAVGYFNYILLYLASKGYQVGCRLLDASLLGVPQKRERVFFIGFRNDLGLRPVYPRPFGRDAITLREALHGVKNVGPPEELGYGQHMAPSMLALLQRMAPGESGAKYHPKGSWFSLERLEWDRPVNTVQASHGVAGGCSCIYPDADRRLTIPELRRVCSFPEDFQLTGPYKERWERLGRSVPPFMMRAIGQSIASAINGRA